MVSAPAYLFDHVAKMIKDLDLAAAPDYTVQVVHVGHGISAQRMKEILDQVYMQKSAEKPAAEQHPAAKPAKPAKPAKSGKSNGGNTTEGGSGDTKEPR